MNSKFVRMAAAIAGTAGLAAAAAVPAQTAPDAGRVLEQFERPVEPTAPPVGLTIEKKAPAAAAVPGGPQVTITEVSLQGVTRFDTATLLAALGDYRNQSFDLAGLHGLADRITRLYRENDYPFAVAYLPAQTIEDGKLVIAVVEGRYGEIRTDGDPALVPGAGAFLAGLEPGAVIEGAPLQRAVHLLGDQPGIAIEPVLMPGTAVGSGDLQVHIEPGKKFAGHMAVDNHGNRHTGAWRTGAAAGVNRLVTFGDQLTLGAMFTDERLWYGEVGYALPIGGSGLRARAGYVHSQYELGGDFATLGAEGNARIATVGLDYPLLRSQGSNLSLHLSYQNKALEDRPSDSFPANDKSSRTVPVAIRFDHRDHFAGGGITWGSVGWTVGRLKLDDALSAADDLTARSEGEFHLAELELARGQELPGPFSLFGRVSGQWTEDNLDSSEGFGLGGADAVRAYPQGEGFGDRGWLAQLELRYHAGQATPYLFYDSGRVEVNADPWAPGDNDRSLAGGGLGVRLRLTRWSIDGAVAWRTEGGKPQSDSWNDQPRFWLSNRFEF